jgi:hypothetical protein
MAHLERALFGEQLRRQQGVEPRLTSAIDGRQPRTHDLRVSLRRHVSRLLCSRKQDAEYRGGQARQGGQVGIQTAERVWRFGGCGWLVDLGELVAPAAGATGGALLGGGVGAVGGIGGIGDGAFGQVGPEELLREELRGIRKGGGGGVSSRSSGVVWGGRGVVVG